jgi:hypothetical protein
LKRSEIGKKGGVGLTNSRLDARPKAGTKKIAVPTPFGVSVSTFLPVHFKIGRFKPG